MRIDERVSLGANAVAAQIAVENDDGNLITIRANDITAVEALPDVVSRFSATEARCLVYWGEVNTARIRDSAANVLAAIDAAVIGLGVGSALIQDQKTPGTDGGTFTSGAFRTRDLTNIVFDPASIATLASNQVTLIAGTYVVFASASGNQVQSHCARLRNISDNLSIAFGTAEFSGSTTNRTVIQADFVINASKIFEVQHSCSATRVGDGFGRATTFQTEIYTSVVFTRTG